MFNLRNVKIRLKLIAMIMVPIAVIMVLAITVFVIWEQIDSRNYIIQDALSHIKMLADNCKASLSFDDKEDAEQILSSLQFKDSIIFACVYNKDGGILAQYKSEHINEKIQAPKPQENRHIFENGYFSVFKQVVLDDEIIGTVYLRDDMRRIHSKLKWDIAIAVVILLIAMATAYFLSSKFQIMISGPIIDLTRVAKDISEKKDYSVRALQESNDEIGYLTQVFNTMLEQIQQRDSALTDARDQLETRVKERTVELTNANQRLTAEVTERVKAEEKFRILFEGAIDAIFIADVETGILLDCNSAGTRLVGREKSELIGKSQKILHPPEKTEEEFSESFKKHISEKRDLTIETQVITRTGEIKEVAIKANVLEIEGKKALHGIFRDVTERKRKEKELLKVNEELVSASHRAGMAEVAADVLHNVGNVLNSINVSTTMITEKVNDSEVANLQKVVSIINDHIEDIGMFLTEHPQGKHIPVYLTEVSKLLIDEQAEIISRLQVLSDNVQHIKDIVSTQQSYAKVSGVEVITSIAGLVEDAIQINSAGLQRHGTRLIRDFEELPDVEIDKHKVLQILVNLISNAKYASSSSEKEEKTITIRIYKHVEDQFRIEVADNGIGIPEDNLTKIFSHGFTTKRHGHGFGLHSSALSSKEIGGSLTVHSDGVGRGALFTLELPYKPAEIVK